jgi:hypothetical protein
MRSRARPVNSVCLPRGNRVIETRTEAARAATAARGRVPDSRAKGGGGMRVYWIQIVVALTLVSMALAEAAQKLDHIWP